MPTLSADSSGKIKIYYEEEGAGDPLVMVGGFTATIEVWGKLRPLLSEKYRVVMADNRGSGRTRVLEDDGVRAPSRFAMDLLVLIDGLEIERAHILGASMGGMVAQEFALQHPARTRSLMIAGSHFGGMDKVKPASGLREIRQRGGSPDATDEERRAALETIFHPDIIRDRPEVVEFYDQNKRVFPHSEGELEARALGMEKFDRSGQVASLEMPVLAITGSHDILVPTENSRLLAERIPNAELFIVEGAGHHFYSEKPETSAQAILEFLSRH